MDVDASEVRALVVESFFNRFGSITAGVHACAIADGGALTCWGTNWAGELGNGTTEASSTPTPVELPGEAISVGLGGLHSCAAVADGRLFCWGENSNGRLGLGDFEDHSLPVGVPGFPLTE
jgi:alpha-tubulin suppressor-like RCC1 family protein